MRNKEIIQKIEALFKKSDDVWGDVAEFIGVPSEFLKKCRKDYFFPKEIKEMLEELITTNKY